MLDGLRVCNEVLKNIFDRFLLGKNVNRFHFYCWGGGGMILFNLGKAKLLH